ncbi:uncharacterized protein LOC120929333 [Rana temporaria]|uniref:uncharacterized protein LOC120929333 n=1 Tax=Rana temporaria TaxID=8407 RepID=UPI001AACF9F3|nr:uncharacterized protein LOC120929333 [Rana temporaria]
MMTLIEEFLQQRVITPVPQQEEGLGCYSHVFLVRKPSGKFRLILNLKILNKSIRYKKFRMDSIYSVRKLLPSGCFLASIDLRDAYLHVPIRASSQRFLRLAIRTGKEVKHFQFRALLLPQNIHEGSGRSTSTTQVGGSICDPIPGRPPAVCQIRGSVAQRPEEDSVPFRGIRLDFKQRKIEPGSLSSDSLSGVFHRLSSGKDLPSGGKNCQSTSSSKGSTDKSPNNCPDSYVHSGSPHSLYSSSSVGPSPCKRSPAGDPPKLGFRGIPGKTVFDPTSGKKKTLVVEDSSKSESGSVMDLPHDKDPNNGCKFLGVGRPSRGTDGPGILVKGGFQEILQLEGVESHFHGTKGLQSASPESTCPSPIGQCHGSGIYLKAGGHEKQVPTESGLASSVLGRSKRGILVCGTPEGRPEPSGGFFEQTGFWSQNGA